MDRFKYGWMLVAVLWLCTPAQAQEFTMEQAVEHALKGNPSVESKLLTLEQAKMNIGVAQSYFWPRVSLVSSNNRLKTPAPRAARTICPAAPGRAASG